MDTKLKIPSKSSIKFPDGELEEEYAGRGFIVIGVDEVGRGALAGPITVGAVAFISPDIRSQIRALHKDKVNDSKLLSNHQRKFLKNRIIENSKSSSTAFVGVNVINKYGIVFAFQKAVRMAVAELRIHLQTDKPFFLLIDAFKIPYIDGVGKRHQLNIIKGDGQCISIAAASILAKLERDNYMTRLSAKFPQYRWHKNKGYGTREHIEAIRKYGITSKHRRLFVRNFC